MRKLLGALAGIVLSCAPLHADGIGGIFNGLGGNIGPAFDDGIGIPSAGVPFWVPNRTNPPDLAFNFTSNLAWTKSTGATSTAASLLTVTRAGTATVNDSSGNWTQVGANLPRISGLGLLVEEIRTNGIRNNTMSGAVPGSPGTPPTNWSPNAGLSLVWSVIGTGTANGIDYIDFRLSGTASGGGPVSLSFEGNTQIAAVNGQVWTESVFTQVVGGSLSNITDWRLLINERDVGGGFLTNGTSSAFAIGPALQQFNFTRTNTNASTAFVVPSSQYTITAAGPVDITLRMGWPQMELGTYATSPIRTLGAAAVTRQNDVVSLTSPPAFGAAYSGYATGTPQAPNVYTVAENLLQYDIGNDTQRTVIRRTAAGNLLYALVGGSGVNRNVTGPFNPNVRTKWAFAETTGDQQFASDGNLAPADTATLPTTPTTVRFGSNSGGTESWNGFIQQYGIWASQRVPNGQLQTMTQ